jgi:methyl-accepting chemotaxis protein
MSAVWGYLETWQGWPAIAALGVLAIVAVLAYAVYRLRGQNGRLTAAFGNMTQGVCMFDGAARVVVCNPRYLEMYKLSSAVVKPGCTLHALIAHRKETGLFTGDVEKYVTEILASVAQRKTTHFTVPAADGRIVRAVNQPMPGGGWVSTHEDVTDIRKFEKERETMAALEQRRTMIEQAIASFRERVDHLLRTVGASAEAVKSTATMLSGSSGEAAQHAESAVHASSDAASSVRSAAVATDELASSIGEIGRQIEHTSKVVRLSVDEAQATDGEIAALSAAAGRIGDVVKMIRDIAGQTNLLALNATIEAARAGDAGRGFAVVASEVKTLAVQTANATEEIAAQIEAVQSSTAGAVDAVRRIAERMQEINHYTTAVAASVEEQSAATGQISSNVANAAQGSDVVVAVLGKVENAAGETRASTRTMLDASQAVETAVRELRGEVEHFLKKVVA